MQHVSPSELRKAPPPTPGLNIYPAACGGEEGGERKWDLCVRAWLSVIRTRQKLTKRLFRRPRRDE